MNVICDTGPLYAFVDRGDRGHTVARRLLARGDIRALVPDPVVVEAEHLMRRSSPPAARAFLADLRAGAFRRLPLDDTLFARALEYDLAFAALNIGLVDAAVMAAAERGRLPILTFDFKDFRATTPIAGGAWELVVSEAMLDQR